MLAVVVFVRYAGLYNRMYLYASTYDLRRRLARSRSAVFKLDWSGACRNAGADANANADASWIRRWRAG